MSATLIPFPLADRLVAVAASGSLLAQPLGGLRGTLSRCLHTCAAALQGDDVDLEAVADLARAVRDPRWDDADAGSVARQVEVALGWLSSAQREAWVASTADGEDTASTSWATDRALDLGSAITRLESAVSLLHARARPGPPTHHLCAASAGFPEWPED